MCCVAKVIGLLCSLVALVVVFFVGGAIGKALWHHDFVASSDDDNLLWLVHHGRESFVFDSEFVVAGALAVAIALCACWVVPHVCCRVLADRWTPRRSGG